MKKGMDPMTAPDHDIHSEHFTENDLCIIENELNCAKRILRETGERHEKNKGCNCQYTHHDRYAGFCGSLFQL